MGLAQVSSPFTFYLYKYQESCRHGLLTYLQLLAVVGVGLLQIQLGCCNVFALEKQKLL